MFAAGAPGDPGYAAMTRTQGTIAIGEPYWPSSNPSMPGYTDGFYGSSNTSAKVVADESAATGKALIMWTLAILVIGYAYKKLR